MLPSGPNATDGLHKRRPKNALACRFPLHRASRFAVSDATASVQGCRLEKARPCAHGSSDLHLALLQCDNTRYFPFAYAGPRASARFPQHPRVLRASKLNPTPTVVNMPNSRPEGLLVGWRTTTHPAPTVPFDRRAVADDPLRRPIGLRCLSTVASFRNALPSKPQHCRFAP
jgi:hypothetical protein